MQEPCPLRGVEPFRPAAEGLGRRRDEPMVGWCARRRRDEEQPPSRFGQRAHDVIEVSLESTADREGVRQLVTTGELLVRQESADLDDGEG